MDRHSQDPITGVIENFDARGVARKEDAAASLPAQIAGAPGRLPLHGFQIGKVAAIIIRN